MLTKRGSGLSRREFVQLAGGTLAALGMSGALTPKLARALTKAAAGRPKVVWLHFARDTGCTESLIKSDHPSAGGLGGTVVYITTMGKVPELDGKGRPKMFYGRKIHDNCPRRTHFDGGRFVEQFGSRGGGGGGGLD